MWQAPTPHGFNRLNYDVAAIRILQEVKPYRNVFKHR